MYLLRCCVYVDLCCEIQTGLLLNVDSERGSPSKSCDSHGSFLFFILTYVVDHCYGYDSIIMIFKLVIVLGKGFSVF